MINVKGNQATIAHFSALEEGLGKIFLASSSYIYCSSIAVQSKYKSVSIQSCHPVFQVNSGEKLCYRNFRETSLL